MIKKTNKENYLTSNQMQVDSTLFIIESGEYVIKEENTDLRNARLGICALCSSSVKIGMGLLGVTMPERM